MPLYSTACPLPVNRKIFRHRGSTSPIPQTDLSLWLKADAGVTISQTPIITQVIVTGFTGIYSGCNGTYNGSDGYYEIDGGAFYIDGNTLYDSNYAVEIAVNNNNYQGAWTPSQYISTIELSGAGDSEADGVYTRAGSQIDMRFVTFSKSGGSITWDYDNAFWYTSQDLYRNYSSTFDDDWQPENGEEPVPSAGYSSSNRNVGSPTSTITSIYPVESWADQSGNERDFVPWYSNASTSLFSGKTFLNFGSDTALYNTSNVIWPDTGSVDYGTIITVARFPFSQPSGSQPSYIFNHGGILYIARGNDLTYPDGITGTKDNDSNAFGNSNLSNNTNYLIGMTFNLDSLTLYLNGTVNGSGSGFENSSPNEMSIGYSPSQPFSIAEIVVYNRVLTTQERQQVEAYLNAKYSIY